MKFSILTATYNRANYLKKLYESIVDNISEEYEIEWLIMDDGSTDNTEEICKFFVNKEQLDVQYYKQQNSGKMQSINNLMDKVSGDFIIECDSDDYFIKNSLKILAKKCKILQANDNLYALIFLRQDDNKDLSGNKFIYENKDTTMFDLYFRQGLTGEKVIVYKTSIREKYKYIIEEGEKFCTEARLHHQIDLLYKVRCFNEQILGGDYHADGYTKNIIKIFKESPKGHYMYFKEILQRNMNGVKFNKRLYVIKHYILFEYLSNEKIKIGGIRDFYNKLLYLLLVIPGRMKSRTIK